MCDSMRKINNRWAYAPTRLLSLDRTDLGEILEPYTRRCYTKVHMNLNFYLSTNSTRPHRANLVDIQFLETEEMNEYSSQQNFYFNPVENLQRLRDF